MILSKINDAKFNPKCDFQQNAYFLALNFAIR